MDGAEPGERLWRIGWTASKLEGRSLSVTKTRYWRAVINKGALVTSITSQDEAYLAELLLNKGYQVVGTFRRLLQSVLVSVPAMLRYDRRGSQGPKEGGYAERTRQRGAHVRLVAGEDTGGKPLSIPSRKGLKHGLLRGLIRDAGITVEELRDVRPPVATVSLR